MNRHHPYTASFENPPARRGNPGPGSDRGGYRSSERGGFRGRGGFNRGRGGYAHYDSNISNQGSYDHGHKLGDMGGYNYEHQSNSYYQNGYAESTPAHFAAQSSGYNQGYPKFEDGPGYDEQDDRSNRRPFRKEKDDKVHDSIIEERIQRERPCRTLFIRNIKYETPSEDVRRIFEEHGEIKTFFDLISTRGMVFVTYYDLRAAERARDRLQGSEISGRPIDVHYSLPRDDQKGAEREKNQQLQGTLQVTLRGSQTGQIDDNELRRKFQQFGDVKSIRPIGDRFDMRYVEFYDTRASTEAYDRLRHQGLQDGVMDIILAWDETAPSGHSPRREGARGDWEERSSARGAGRGRGRGKGRGRGFDDYDDRRDYSRPDREYRGRGGRYDDFGRGARPSGYNNRYDDDRAGYGNGYNAGSSGYNMGPPPQTQGRHPSGPPDERLEQARKVQQLLAALKPATGAPPVASPSAPPVQGMSQIPALASTNAYYPPAPATTAYLADTSNPYSAVHPTVPPPTISPPPALSNPALTGLTPNILSLLQSQQPQSRLPTAASQPPYNIPPAAASLAGSLPAASNPQYQQLMAYLQSQGVPPTAGK